MKTKVLAFLLSFLFIATACEISDYPYYLKRKKLNVSFVLDISGSMGGTNITSMREAAKMMLDKLNDQDILSIVVFSDSVGELLPPTYVTDKPAIITLINSIMAGGGTEILSGMQKGYEWIEENYDPTRSNRQILLTDGSDGGVAEEKFTLATLYKSKGITISTIALGGGADTTLLEGIASAGDGKYYFIENPTDLSQTIKNEIILLLSPLE